MILLSNSPSNGLFIRNWLFPKRVRLALSRTTTTIDLAANASSSRLIALSRMVFDKEIGSDSLQMEFNLPDTTYPCLLEYFVPRIA